MGTVLGRMLKFEDVTRYWPPNIADKKHWCMGGKEHYCDDDPAAIQSQDDDLPFDYSSFRCREATCQTCLDLDPNFYPSRSLWPGDQWVKKDQKSREIHFTWKSMKEAAYGDCETCGILEEGIRLVGGAGEGVLDELSVFCLEILEGFTVRITLEIPIEQGELRTKEKLAVEFHSILGRPTPWKAFGTARKLTKDISVSDYVEFINSRMKKCLDHPKCVLPQGSLNGPEMPVRLIDIGAGNDAIRLEIYPQREKYIALSHLWSTIPLPETTISNFQQRCRNIPWMALSKTFQEAISLTRGLGIRYLWIDSLCIIQDSTSDWETEARNMSSIYTNSYLTIAATSAADSSEGLLRPRCTNVQDSNNEEPDFIHEYEIERKSQHDSSSQNYLIFARRPLKYSHECLLAMDYKVTHAKMAPLLRRAWVLQERLLSPRIMHFCSDELVWECREGMDCECGFGVSSSGRAESDSLVGRNKFKELFLTSTSNSYIHNQQLILAWYHLLEYYMTLSITFPSDRLPALRGMTQYLSEKIGWTNVGGIWIEDFARGALFYKNWMRSYQRNAAAPSWSWASLLASDEVDEEDKSLPPEINSVIDFPEFLHAEGETWTVDEVFRVLDYEAKLGRTQEDERFLDGGDQKAGKKREFVVVEGRVVDAIIVKESLESEEDVKNGDPEEVKEIGESLDTNAGEAQTATEPEESENGDNIKATKPSIALRLSVKGNSNLIKVGWDITQYPDIYSEVAEDDEVLAMVLVHSGGVEMDTEGHGLVLKRDEEGERVYRRVGYFSAAGKEGYFSGEGRGRKLVLV